MRINDRLPVACKSPTSFDEYHMNSNNIILPTTPNSVNRSNSGLRLYRIQDSNKKADDHDNKEEEELNDSETSVSSEPKVSQIIDIPTPIDTSKVHETNMPPPPKRKKKNRYRHVQTNSHSIVYSPHSLISPQSGWNYQDYRAAYHDYNANSAVQQMAYRDVQEKMHQNDYMSDDQFEDDLDAMKETLQIADSGEDDTASVQAVNGTASTDKKLILNGNDSTNYSLPSTVSAVAPQSRHNRQSLDTLSENVLMEGNENENEVDDEGVDLEIVKKEINEMMVDDENDIDNEEKDALEIDAADEKGSYVKKFDYGDDDEEFPKFTHRRAITHSETINEDTYLKYLE